MLLQFLCAVFPQDLNMIFYGEWHRYERMRLMVAYEKRLQHKSAGNCLRGWYRPTRKSHLFFLQTKENAFEHLDISFVRFGRLFHWYHFVFSHICRASSVSGVCVCVCSLFVSLLFLLALCLKCKLHLYSMCRSFVKHCSRVHEFVSVWTTFVFCHKFKIQMDLRIYSLFFVCSVYCYC